MYFEELIGKYEEVERNLNLRRYELDKAVRDYVKNKHPYYTCIHKWYIEEETGTIVVYFVDMMGMDRDMRIAGDFKVL